MLRFSVFLSAVCAVALVQTGKTSPSVFEPDYFDVNAALYNLGVDISAIPAFEFAAVAVNRRLSCSREYQFDV
jgi:hypothetical protein